MNGFLVFLFLLVAYILTVYGLNRAGKLGGAFELMGPFLMMRTQKGKPTIERISKAKRTWAIFGDVGILLTAVAGILMLVGLLFQLYVFVSAPKMAADSAPPAQYLIGLPGVNPLIPIGYGIFGLIVALVIHEGCHGILSRHAGIQVKSLGLLWFIVPIGAFVEPDEADLEKATPRERLRMFAAGPTSNLVLAVVAGLLFSQVAMASLAIPEEGKGVIIQEVTDGYGAANASVTPGSILTHINGEPIRDWVAFNATLTSIPYDETNPPTITLTLLREGETREVPVELSSKYAYRMKLYNEGVLSQPPPEEFKTQGFLGVSVLSLAHNAGHPMAAFDGVEGRTASLAGMKDLLENPLSHGVSGFFFYISYPFYVLRTGQDIMNDPYNGYFEPAGMLEGMNPVLFFMLANTLYWLFWLNLMLGTFNALPAGPLDGGQMLRTSVRAWLWRLYGVDRTRTRVERNLAGPGVMVLGNDEETQRKLDRAHAVLKRTTMTLGLLILGLILMPVVGPQLIRLFI